MLCSSIRVFCCVTESRNTEVLTKVLTKLAYTIYTPTHKFLIHHSYTKPLESSYRQTRKTTSTQKQPTRHIGNTSNRTNNLFFTGNKEKHTQATSNTNKQTRHMRNDPLS